ncbi:MAG: ThiF family adenylyltransferase, partial [Planctomycetaceae bacterium]
MCQNRTDNKTTGPLPQLTSEDFALREWQLDVRGFGEAGQQRLKGASVLVSRVGGLGSVVAYELAAAGVGRLILAHAGNVRHSDLNRQLLMTHDWIGKPRIESAARRLKELNPHLEIEAVPENVSAANAARLVEQAENAHNSYTGLADRAAQIYAPVVHLLALFAFIGWFIG